tara:strand:- start:8195 stop:9169 length:975 start_codon:yes stop_codon:yes gene_type:complete
VKPEAVLITLFEPDDGSPGEFSRFRERFQLEPLDDSPLPNQLFSDPAGKILAVIAGVGAVQTATVITALGMDPRFDFSETLWLVAGIAGGDPDRTPLGSPVWADWCIDGDLAWEIDGREIPPEWSTGLLPLGAKAPYTPPAGKDGVFGSRYESVPLSKPILEWAVETTRNVPLASSEQAQAEGARYAESPAAASSPRVLIGATLSAVRFWHGHHMNEWANRWVEMFTKGQSRFHTSNMEDSGTLFALRYLANRGRVRWEQVLILRTVSNFTRPPAGEPSVSTLIGEEEEAFFPGFSLALENGYRVAAAVLNGWTAGDRPPAPHA